MPRNKIAEAAPFLMGFVEAVNRVESESVTLTLRVRYREAVAHLHCPWADRPPSYRFAEYDQFRAIWCQELHQWLYGDNPRGVHSLTQLAWKVQHARISDGGRIFNCLNFSDRTQRVYLGDGLLEYLGLLKDDLRIAQEGK